MFDVDIHNAALKFSPHHRNRRHSFQKFDGPHSTTPQLLTCETFSYFEATSKMETFELPIDSTAKRGRSLF